ncbi:ABC transporter F family member 4-like [Ananas comosus]|uniref:ABC transporter F family member 4-like n=1 Tax=Ananas comosus TaxID=4615 RepID=A0A6P5F7L1_ANACO|nr:ABC transporter F family member 4-like [Ananas comosus]
MSEAEPTSAMEETPAANGSDSTPKDAAADSVSEKKDSEQKKDGVTEKDGEEKKDGVTEKKDGEEKKNGVTEKDSEEKKDCVTEKEDGEKIKDDKVSKDTEQKIKTDKKGVETEEANDLREEGKGTKEVTTVEAEVVKTVDAENTETAGGEDVKMVDTEDAKAADKADDVKMVETEDVKAEDKEKGGADDVKMVETEDVKDEDTKKVGFDDVKMVDAEHVKDEDAEKVHADDVKTAQVEDTKDEGKGQEEREEKEKEEEKEEEEEEAEAMEEKDGGQTVNKADLDEAVVETPKKKRSRRQKVSDKEKGNNKKKDETKSKELSTPVISPSGRPVRERKTVERLVEVIEKEPNRTVVIEKGRGTPLKDIPNVAYKLARKKPTELKLLHQTLFGRKGKAVNYKNHILQFSGFVWHESDEKQRAKMKEKLDKYVKDTLLDMCDLFDIPVSKANTRKEDLVAKLLDFIVAPHATSDVILADKEQATNSRKRSRGKGSASKSTEDTPAKRSRKSGGTPGSKGKTTDESEGEGEGEDEDEEEEEEDEDEDNTKEDEEAKHSESDEKEDESEEESEEDEADNSVKDKRDTKKASRMSDSLDSAKLKGGSSSKKAPLSITTKSPIKTVSSKRSKGEESDDVDEKVFSRKKKSSDMPKKISTPEVVKEKKGSGKKVTRGKGKSTDGEQPGPNKEELRKTINEILKGVDFNTATFSDILKKLAVHYKMDMASRKASIKLMIQEELTKLAEEAEENEDEDEEDEEEEAPVRKGKEVEV